MAALDRELETLKREVSCAALLEQLAPTWKLDGRESTRSSLKYRRGEGEVLIVNHNQRGWWDPLSSAKGDVCSLVQHLDRSLNLGQVRQLLRRFIGVSPTFPEALRTVGEAFATEIMGAVVRIQHTEAMATWSVDGRAFAGTAAGTSLWGTRAPCCTTR